MAQVAFITSADPFQTASYAHTIDSPTEVLTGQSESGRMLAVWISDAAGTKTLVKLQDS